MHDPLEIYVGQLNELVARADTILRRAEQGPKAHITFKTVAQVTRDYEDALDRFVHETLDRRMDKTDFRRAHKALIRSVAREVYVEGVREGGGEESDIEESDTKKIAAWVREQAGHVDAFSDAIWEASGVGADESKRDAALARVPLWTASLTNLGDLGRLAVLGDPMLTYDGEDGAESCAECQTYKFQRHRRSWWERRDLLRRNGNENYTCGRWQDHCLHFFRNDAGEVIVN
jgi:hypothetical protein